jgi:hypothetical protein
VDSPQGLIEKPRPTAEPESSRCPGCGERWTPLPPVTTSLHEHVALRRCGGCGARWAGESPPRPLRDCDACGVGTLDESRPPVCPGCRDGELTAPGAELIVATEAEVLRALALTWRFVGSDGLSAYLDRLCRDIARILPGAPASPRVMLVDADPWGAVALPSGVVLLTRGALASCADESECVFLLARQLAHVASGAAGADLVRAGLRALARGREEDLANCWSHAIEDLVKLGHGEKNELAADDRAIEVVVALGYDPRAVRHWIQRLREATGRGESDIAELALAMPDPRARERRIEGMLDGMVDLASGGHTNRQVFRRAAGHTVLSSELRPCSLPFDDAPDPERRVRLVWVALATLVTLVGGTLLAVFVL